jgi:chorismate mutase
VTGRPETDPLKDLRARLDVADDALIAALGERFRVIDEIAAVKKHHGIPMMAPDRVAFVTSKFATRLREFGLANIFGEDLATLLVDEACRRELDLMGEGN